MTPLLRLMLGQLTPQEHARRRLARAQHSLVESLGAVQEWADREAELRHRIALLRDLIDELGEPPK